MARTASTTILAMWLLAWPLLAQESSGDLVALQQEKIVLLEERVVALEELVQLQDQTIAAQDTAISALQAANEAWRDTAGVKKRGFWAKAWMGLQIAASVASVAIVAK